MGFAVEAEDPAVVDDAVDDRGGHVPVAEHVAPSAGLEVRGGGDAAGLVAVRAGLEQEPGPVDVDGQVAQLVDDQQPGAAYRAQLRVEPAPMPSQTLGDKLRRVYDEIDEWRSRPLESEYPYVFVDGVWHKRSWGGRVENVSVLVAIGINAEGHREVIGVTEGMREDSASWEQFFRGMIERGLKGVRLVVGDRCAGLVATVGSMLPKAKYQRCMVHFMRNVLSKVPPIHREWASAALKAVFAMESRESALDKAEQVAAEMRSRRLRAAANCLREGVGETTTYLLDEFPDGHRRRIRTNNMIERLNREIRRRTRVVGGFPDGNSALMLVCARIRYVTANEWSTRRYLDMSRFDDNLVEAN